MVRRVRLRLLLGICIGFGLAASLPLWLTPGLPNNDDSLTHTFNLFALDRQVRAGNLFPLRFPDHGLGYGYAVLAYYPPLPYALLEMIQLLGGDYVLTFKLGLTLMTACAGLTSFWFGKTVFDEWAGLVTAFLYLFNPYFLANLHIRGALAEQLGLAVGPLVFLAIYLVIQRPRWRTYLLASLSVALISLAHFLSTLLYLPFAVLYALWTLTSAPANTRQKSFGILLAAAFSGVGISCFYWLPAALERDGLKQIDNTAALAAYLRELTPLTQLLKPTLMIAYAGVHQMPELGLPLILLLLVAFGLMFASRRYLTQVEWAQWLFFSLAAVIGILLSTVVADSFWRALPAISLLQFPFRWLGPAAFFAAGTVGATVHAVTSSPVRFVRLAIILFCILFCLVLLWYGYASLGNLPIAPAMLRSLGVERVETQQITLAGLRAFEHDQADNLREHCWGWAYEYVPRTSALSDCATMRDTILLDLPFASDLPPVEAHIQPIWITPNGLQASVSSPQPWTLSVHAFWLPGWRASIDGQAAPVAPVASSGMAGLVIPAGDHLVQIEYGLTLLRWGTLVVSALLLIVWIGLALRYRPALATAVVVLLALLVGGPAFTSAQATTPPPVHTARVEFAGQVALQGYGIEVIDDRLHLNLVWLARKGIPVSDKVFVHVIDDTGKLWSQDDSRPAQYASNTNRWLPGQVILDEHWLSLPTEMPPGRYQVRVGLYGEEDGQRLPVVNEQGEVIDDQVLLDYIELSR